ncbi:MAG: glycosyltransferase, partial [Terracidiphilus sp.]|nr:glycosyltransferase [Terracidiphilus sp.]
MGNCPRPGNGDAAQHRSIVYEKTSLLTCVHIVKNAQPECTGIVRIVSGLAKRSASRGYAISVLFLGEGPLESVLKEEGIPVSTIPWEGTRNDLAAARRVWSWLRKHPAKIAHLHHGGLAVRVACRLAGVTAVVQHIHGRIIESDGASVSKIGFRMVDAVIANSQAVADCLPGRNAQVVYAGIETGSHPPALTAPSGPLKLGVLARLIPLKNVGAVISATAGLASRGIEVHTEIAGSGPSEPSLRDLAARLGVAERVHFLGWQTDVPRLLASWDLLVIPSLEEGFGLSALEAMGAARPVVASRVGGLCELVVDGVTGNLVPPGDTDALIRCIALLANDRQ